MTRTFKIDDLIKAMKKHDHGLYSVVDIMGIERIYIPGLNIDRGLVETIEKNRKSLACDIFVEKLPEPGWTGAVLEILIKPQYHDLIKVNGVFDDIQTLSLMRHAGIKKITFETEDA